MTNTKTCKDCTEFNDKREECGCPMMAYPNVYTGEYTYAKTSESSQACMFFYPIKQVK
jgi:hypothetical protein